MELTFFYLFCLFMIVLGFLYSSKSKRDQWNAYYMLLIILCFVIIGYINNWIRPWTLMVCSTLTPDGKQCDVNAIIEKGFFTKVDCYIAGIRYTTSFKESYPGFECGKYCKKKSYGYLCDIICDGRDCHK